MATRIWGGNSAEDTWGIYKSTDTQAPTTPLNVTLSNISLNSIDISWDASTDNIGVTGYNVLVNGVLQEQTTNTNVSIADLNTNTTYSFSVVAKDLINNMSAESPIVNGTTLKDLIAPTTPTNVIVSNETDSSFKVSWTASTDNNAVANYDVYVDNTLVGTTSDVFYIVGGLTASTNYSVQILAKDTDNNESDKTAAISATTTAGTFNGVSELFISEYTEPSEKNNKAIEIVNLSGATINLSAYSIQKQSNGGSWVDDYPLGDVDIIPGDVFVIVHADVVDQTLIDEADLYGPPNIDTSPYGFGSPMNFNGNDPIGLYKNGVLIDIIGEEDNSKDHIHNKTWRRKASIKAPNTTFTESEWEILPSETFDNFGSHTSTLSTADTFLNTFKMYPNPTNGNKVYFNLSENIQIQIYNVLGKQVLSTKLSKDDDTININTLSKGVYLVKITTGKQATLKKLIKN